MATPVTSVSHIPRLEPGTANLVASVLAIVLLLYIFGLIPILSGLMWLAFGAVIGWVGSLVLRSDSQRTILFDILTGAIGGMFGVLLIGGGSFTEIGPLERVFAALLGSVLTVSVAGFAKGGFRRYGGAGRRSRASSNPNNLHH